MSRLKNITAIVLNKRDFMESDLFLTLLDDEGKRFEVLVKGAGSQKSRRRRHLERMNLIKGTLYEGKTHLYLQDVECQSSFSLLKDDLDRILQASVLLELTERCLFPDDPHQEIYTLILHTLELLNKKDAQSHVIDISLVQLANHLGYLPNFRECSQCHGEKIEENLHWDREHGTLHCDDCGLIRRPLSMKYRKAMEFFRQSQVKLPQQLKLGKLEHEELRSLIYELFQAHLHAPLKSLSFSSL